MVWHWRYWDGYASAVVLSLIDQNQKMLIGVLEKSRSAWAVQVTGAGMPWALRSISPSKYGPSQLTGVVTER